MLCFLWAGVPGAQIRLLCDQYGNKVLSRRIFYEWIENGRTSVTDAEFHSMI